MQHRTSSSTGRTSKIFISILVSYLMLIAPLAQVAVAAARSRQPINAGARRADGQQRRTTPETQHAQSPGSNSLKEPQAPAAVAISATKTDAFADSDGDGKAELGETISYTVNINNSGADDALAVLFNDTLDANTTLVPGSVHAQPQARANAYTTVGNTLLEVSNSPSSTAPKVTATGTLFDNDSVATDTFALQSFQATSANGGTVSVNADGTFTYLPAVGFTGTDTFTYTLRNTAATTPVLTDTATVTITVGGPRVWYVNNAVSNGDGRSTSPFNSLTPVNGAGGAGDADAANDIIYVFTGAGNYTTGIILENNQLLIGNGIALVVNTFTLRAAGARPTITNGSGNGVTLASANTLSGFNLGNASGFAIQGTNVGALTVNNMAINTTGGGLDLTGVSTPTVSVVLDSLTSSGGTRNVNLVGLNGTVTLGSGALSGATTAAFDVSGAGNAVITYTGTVGNTAARTINVSGKNGGSVSFSGAVSGTGTGVNLVNNTGATINFTGGINLSTGANNAFVATGGGTVNATQNNAAIVNTLTTTTGTALNVSDTNIGASGLTFRSISSNGGSNHGIILDDTGPTAGLTITANGGTCTSAATCTGGAIQNKTGADNSTTQGSGIYMNNVVGVSLDRMQFNDFQNHAIRGQGVTGFSLTNSNISGTNGTSGAGGSREGHIHFNNLFTSASFPTAAITNCNLNGTSFSDHLRVENTSGTLNRLTVTNVTFGPISSGGNDALNFTSFNNAVMNLTVTGSTLTNAIGSVVNVVVNNNSVVDLVFRQNRVSNNNVNASSGAGGIRVAGGSGVNTLTYDISCNRIRDSIGIALLVAKGTGAGVWNGSIVNNVVGVAGSGTLTGSTQGSGIKVATTGQGSHTTFIANNDVRRYNEIGIFLQNNDGSSTLNATVFGNITAEPGSFAFAGLSVDNGALASDSGAINVVVGSAANAAQKNDFSNGDPSNFSDVNFSRIGTGLNNLSRNGSAGGTPAAVIDDDNLNPATTNTSVSPAAGTVLVNTLPATPPTVAACSLPAPREIGGGDVMETSYDTSDANSDATAPATDEAPARVYLGTPEQSVIRPASAPAKVATAPATASINNAPASPSADNINLNLGTLNANDSVQIIFQATVNNPFPAGPLSVSNQGTISGGNFASVLTDDPSVAGTANPTVTPVDVIMLSINDVTIAEGAIGTRNMTFTISVTGTTANAISVQVETANNTATAPADYVAIPLTTINIPGNTPSTTVTVQVNGDTIFEGNENFFVNLSNVSSGTLIQDGQGIGTIADDEPMTGDLSGDGLTDAAIWNSSNGTWFLRNSNTGTVTQVADDWGRASLGDRAVPGDYDGDNKIDIAIFRQGEGNWYILKSSLGNTPFVQNWGQNGDIPVPADYDNDGVTDIAVWRPSQGNWYILKSNNGTPINSVQNWGVSTDKPVVGDFDGDGKSDLAVFRTGEGNWYILNSSTGAITVQNWGVGTDKLVPGDYDGDGRTDMAVYRTGTWFIRKSSGGTIVKSWGDPTDLAVPGDYDGDGITDIAIWRPSEGKWYAINSSTNTVNLQTIEVTGVPVPNAYLPQ